MRSRLEPKPSESSGDHPREGRLRREGGSRPNLPRHYGKRATGLYAEAPSEVGAVAPPNPLWVHRSAELLELGGGRLSHWGGPQTCSGLAPLMLQPS